MTVLFTLWGYDVTAIEFASVVTAFLAIGLGIRGTRWTWPFYFLSSLLYGWLFVRYHLFASAAMQLIFMAAAIWARPTRSDEGDMEGSRGPCGPRFDGEIIPGQSGRLYDVAAAVSSLSLRSGGIYAK